MIPTKAKRIKTTNWTETLRQMSINSILECTIEEKDILAPIASKMKSESREYSFEKNSQTKKYKVTRIK